MSDEKQAPSEEEERITLDDIVREFRGAVAFCLGRTGALAADDRGRGGMFFPVMGLVGGLLSGVLATMLDGSAPPIAVALLAVFSLAAMSGFALVRGAVGGAGRVLPGPPVPTGGVVVGLLVAGEVWAILTVGPSARILALMLAGTLGRWAYVVQAYGSQPDPADPDARPLIQKMKFREFGTASVSAMALTLMLADAVGLVLLMVIATLTVSLRIFVHSRREGVSPPTLALGGLVGETVTLLGCALLAKSFAAV